MLGVLANGNVVLTSTERRRGRGQSRDLHIAATSGRRAHRKGSQGDEFGHKVRSAVSHGLALSPK